MGLIRRSIFVQQAEAKSGTEVNPNRLRTGRVSAGTFTRLVVHYVVFRSLQRFQQDPQRCDVCMHVLHDIPPGRVQRFFRQGVGDPDNFCLYRFQDVIPF